ncbi:MAG: class I SAM-dependent methyltransferase [Synechococcales cyanobacterium CRU_2_2]|nr:class I SAM-dependent methyltransferase [Synechococcales cyanobacterium CRU_2_2]
MAVQSEELLEKIRQQFDFGPYPRIPIESTPKNNLQDLFNHNLITPYYMRYQKLPKLAAPMILDIGCGTGYKALELALANPSAQIVGIDISAKSIELAQARFAHHEQKNAEFRVLDVADLHLLGQKFDYINCDELLYLFPNPAETLAIMASVLQPEGIIRSNLHSSLQRAAFFRAQEMFQMMGLMDENPEEVEIELAIEILKSIKPQVDLRQKTYSTDDALDKEDMDQQVLMNLLFQGDKGYTISDLFNYLEEANLEFVSMLNPRQWEILELVKDPNNLPVFLSMGLESISIEERLHLYELIHPRHRLLDFWCGHPIDETEAQGSITPISDWSEQDWLETLVHLHPQLKAEKVKTHIIEAATQSRGCNLGQFLPLTTGAVSEWNAAMAAVLLPLWERPHRFPELVEHWLKIHPVDFVTSEPISHEKAAFDLRQFLTALEIYLYVLLEHT